MFVFHRTAIPVLLPLVLLLAVAWWSNRTPHSAGPALEAQKALQEGPREVTAEREPLRVAAGAPSRRT